MKWYNTIHHIKAFVLLQDCFIVTVSTHKAHKFSRLFEEILLTQTNNFVHDKIKSPVAIVFCRLTRHVEPKE